MSLTYNFTIKITCHDPFEIKKNNLFPLLTSRNIHKIQFTKTEFPI